MRLNERLEPAAPADDPFAAGAGKAVAATALDDGTSPPVAGLVAVVGCDGSGKTRLAHDLVAHLAERRATERRYLGLISGETGDKIKRLPLIGTVLESYLARKVRRAQDMKRKLPGLPTAIVMYLFSLWRAWHLRRLIRRAQSGVLVIAERYPQAEIPGFHYDGPGLAVERSRSALVRKLAAREQKIYDWMASQKPAMVIRLTIDADTAFARKPDHPLPELRDKVETMMRINYNGARIVEVDSRLPYPQVLNSAVQVIEAVMVTQAW
jgi:thymidylate kinase